MPPENRWFIICQIINQLTFINLWAAVPLSPISSPHLDTCRETPKLFSITTLASTRGILITRQNRRKRKISNQPHFIVTIRDSRHYCCSYDSCLKSHNHYLNIPQYTPFVKSIVLFAQKKEPNEHSLGSNTCFRFNRFGIKGFYHPLMYSRWVAVA